MRAYRLQLMKWESVVVSADQLLSQVSISQVQTADRTSQFFHTAGAVPLCERRSVHVDTDKVSRHLPFPFGFLPQVWSRLAAGVVGVGGGPGAGVG